MLRCLQYDHTLLIHPFPCSWKRRQIFMHELCGLMNALQFLQIAFNFQYLFAFLCAYWDVHIYIYAIKSARISNGYALGHTPWPMARVPSRAYQPYYSPRAWSGAIIETGPPYHVISLWGGHWHESMKITNLSGPALCPALSSQHSYWLDLCALWPCLYLKFNWLREAISPML